MAKKNNDAILELSAVTQAIREATEKHNTVVEGGVNKGNSEFYESTLPSDLTMDTVRAVHEHDRRFMIGTAAGSADLAAAQLAADPNLQSATFNFQAGRNKITHTVNREGALVSGYGVYGTGGTGGEYKKVADYTRDLVTNLLG